MDRYCPEYNRTMPQQTEGPEYTPYINKGTVAEKPSPSALLAALLAAAALAALLLPLCFSIRNVGPYSAELHYRVTAEEGYEETDLITFQLYSGGELLGSGQIPFGEDFLDLVELTPDTRYSVLIFRNGEPEKTLPFRTPPLGDPEPEPAPEPEPIPEPEPPSEPPVPETQAPTVPETSEETVPETSEETVPETSEETVPETSVETQPPYTPPYNPPDDSDDDPPAPPPAPPAVTGTPLTIDNISHDYNPYIDETYIVYLNFNVTPNDSEDISYQVFLNDNLAYEGTEDRCEIYNVLPGYYVVEVIAHFTTNGTPGSLSQTLPISLGNTHNAPGVSGVTLTRSGTDLVVSGNIGFADADPDSVSIQLDTGISSFNIPYLTTDGISGTFSTTIPDFPFSDPYPTYVSITIPYTYRGASLMIMTDYTIE